MAEKTPEDDTKRRFRAALAAKKRSQSAGNTPEAQREGRPARPGGPAQGGRGFTRRKV